MVAQMNIDKINKQSIYGQFDRLMLECHSKFIRNFISAVEQ